MVIFCSSLGGILNSEYEEYTTLFILLSTPISKSKTFENVMNAIIKMMKYDRVPAN